MHKFKKGDKIKAISSIGELEKGKTYVVKRLVNDDAVELAGDFEYNYLECEFKKAINIKAIKKIDTINPRVDTNLEKINEIIDVINQLSKIIKDLQ